MDKNRYFIDLADHIAAASTCCRRKVGCILVDSNGIILATGYNGVASGLPHCNRPFIEIQIDRSEKTSYPNACEGAFLPSGTGLDKCQAIHAEQNALMQCPDIHKIHSCYVTTSPCIHCVKMLMNTSCENIFFKEEYSHEKSMDMWLDSGTEKGLNRLWSRVYVDS